jgi:RNA polymerase sigma factor (sigma-70 family)
MNEICVKTAAGVNGVDGADRTERAADAELLAALAGGEVGAFWRLWRRHQPDLHRVCLRELNGHAADAEDALSQAMLKALDHLPVCAGQVLNPAAWLRRLTRNLCIDLRREQFRRAKAAESWKQTALADTKWDEPWRQIGVEAEILQQITKLPLSLRESFMLHVLREMPAKGVASQLGLSVANVRKRVQLARARLRDLQAGQAVDHAEPAPATRPPTPLAAPSQPMPRREPPRELYPCGGWMRTVRVKLPCGVTRMLHAFASEAAPVSTGRKAKALQNYLRQHPDGWKKRLELAELLHLAGRWREAAHEWERVLGGQLILPAALKLGDTLLKLGANKAAADVFRRARQHESAAGAVGLHLDGWTAYCEKNPGRAVREFQAAAGLEPENPAHLYGLALAHGKTGARLEALAAIQLALTLDADDLVALSLGHEMLVAAGDFAEAVRRAEHVLRLSPLDLLTTQRLAVARCQLELTHGAAGAETKKLLRQSLRLSGNSLLSREALAAFFRLQGQPRRMLSVHSRFVEEHPHCPEGARQHSQLLASVGQANRPPSQPRVGNIPGTKCCNGACEWHGQPALSHV